MRLNKYIASGTNLSRRSADAVIATGQITVNGSQPEQGYNVQPTDVVALNGTIISPVVTHTTIILHKPVGYVVSRQGQGSATIYDLLPAEYHNLNPVGRLDKDSSGLLLLTDDGVLTHELTHPSKQKIKRYEVTLDKQLQPLHRQMISDYGVTLDDGVSKFELERMHDGDETAWYVSMHEGRNRQIRRTFQGLGYSVKKLHRTHFGKYQLQNLRNGSYQIIDV